MFRLLFYLKIKSILIQIIFFSSFLNFLFLSLHPCFSLLTLFLNNFFYIFFFSFFLLILLRSRMIWLRLHVMFDHLLIIRYNQTTQTKIQTYISNKQTNNQKHIQNHNLTLKPQNQNKQNQKKTIHKKILSKVLRIASADKCAFLSSFTGNIKYWHHWCKFYLYDCTNHIHGNYDK